MKVYPWDEKYLVSHAQIDQQHNYLFSTLWDLQLDLYTGITHEGLLKKLQGLERYCYEHFSTEKKLLDPYKDQISNYNEHMEDHRIFALAIKDFFVRFEGEGVSIAAELFEYLGAWLENHVFTVDRQSFAELHAIDDSQFTK